jgi:hypothetical protein
MNGNAAQKHTAAKEEKAGLVRVPTNAIFLSTKRLFMSTSIARISLCLTLCLVLSSCMSCGDQCIEYQNIASIELDRYISEETSRIDSIAMKANDSIDGCYSRVRSIVAVGSKTHRVKFPINVRFQLFSQGDLQKEFFFEMSKNTAVIVYTGLDCSRTDGEFSYFRHRVNQAMERNTFIDSSSTGDYCWLTEKMVGDYYDTMRCTATGVSELELCELY